MMINSISGKLSSLNNEELLISLNKQNPVKAAEIVNAPVKDENAAEAERGDEFVKNTQSVRSMFDAKSVVSQDETLSASDKFVKNEQADDKDKYKIKYHKPGEENKTENKKAAESQKSLTETIKDEEEKKSEEAKNSDKADKDDESKKAKKKERKMIAVVTKAVKNCTEECPPGCEEHMVSKTTTPIYE